MRALLSSSGPTGIKSRTSQICAVGIATAVLVVECLLGLLFQKVAFLEQQAFSMARVLFSLFLTQ